MRFVGPPPDAHHDAHDATTTSTTSLDDHVDGHPGAVTARPPGSDRHHLRTQRQPAVQRRDLLAAAIDAQLGAVRATGVTVARSDALWELTEPRRPVNGVHTYDWSFRRPDRRGAGRAMTSPGCRSSITPPSGALPAEAGHGPPTSCRRLRRLRGRAGAPLRPRWGVLDRASRAHRASRSRRSRSGTSPTTASSGTAALTRPRTRRMYIAARDAVAAAVPSIRVLIGGLTDPPATLAGMLQAHPELAGHIDGVAVHPYGPPLQMIVKLREDRAAMTALGLGAVPLYVTEFGWVTHPRGALGWVPAERRPQDIRTAMTALGHTDCGISQVDYYTWITPERNPADREDWFGHPAARRRARAGQDRVRGRTAGRAGARSDPPRLPRLRPLSPPARRPAMNGDSPAPLAAETPKFAGGGPRAERSRQRRLVGANRLGPAPSPRELRRDGRARRIGQHPPSVGVIQEVRYRRGQPRLVVAGDEHHPAPGARDLLGAVLTAAAERRDPARHRLDVGDAEGLGDAGHDEQRGPPGDGHGVGLRARPVHDDTVADPEAAGLALQRGPLRAVTDDLVAQAGMTLRELRQRGDHQRVALAGDQIADRDQRRARGPGRASAARQPDPESAPEVHDPRRSRSEHGAATGGARAVGEHDPGVPQRRGHVGVAGVGTEHIAAVHRDDGRDLRAGAAGRVAGGHGVVGVDEVEGKARPQPRSGPAQGGGGPRPPARVAPRPWRGEVAQVLDRHAVQGRARRLGQCPPDRVEIATAQAASGGSGRCSTSTRTSAPASRAASAWRWAQMPSTGSAARG